MGTSVGFELAYQDGVVHQVEGGCLVDEEGGRQLLGLCSLKTEGVSLDEGCGCVMGCQAAVVITMEETIAREVRSELVVDHMFSEKAELDSVGDGAVVIKDIPVRFFVVRVYGLLFPHGGEHPSRDGEVDDVGDGR